MDGEVIRIIKAFLYVKNLVTQVKTNKHILIALIDIFPCRNLGTGANPMDTSKNVAALSNALDIDTSGSTLLAGFSLGDIKKTIWLTRPDLRNLCEDNWERFEWWLLMNGAREYRALAESGVETLECWLNGSAENAVISLESALTRLMDLMLWLRPDLKNSFNEQKIDQHQAFLWWLLTEGARESEPLAQVATVISQKFLSAPAQGAFFGVQPSLTCLMYLVWSMRPDLQDAFNLGAAEEQQGFVRWYFIHGLAELRFARYVTDEQKRLLRQPDERLPDDPVVPINRLMVLVWQQRSDLQQAFSLDDPTGRAAFVDWFIAHGVSEMRLADLYAGEDATSRRTTPPTIKKGQSGLPFGVNLIGYARGQFGIGEDVRMAALAMQAANIPFSIHNIEPGREVCQGDDSVEALITDGLPYAVNMLCTTGIETARLAAVEGSALFDGRRTIGYWPWELPEWPEDWRHAYALVDEVWASSRYTYEAYAKSCPKQLRHLPMAVTVDATVGLSRRDFRLPEDRFLFVFSFDALSSLSRKNPQACMQAFKEAFPFGDEPVGLVVKAMRVTLDNPVWRVLLEEARADRRISIISKTLSRGAVLDLYRVCDAFVSLHRAEGFGRGIAEAMMLGKPVIVTGYSGNLDFTTPGTSALVDYRLRLLNDEEYPFGAGKTWAEPDVSHAAWWMRRFVVDCRLRQRLAEHGRNLVMATYAPAIVGERYAAVLKQTMGEVFTMI